VSGKASMAAENICIAASTKLTMTGASPSSRPPSFLDRFVLWKESSMMITPSEIAIGDVETLARIHRLDKVGPTGTIRAAHRRESNTTA
jgi:hypothetical protein